MSKNNYIFELSDKVTRTSVSYTTRYGIALAADLYRPADFDETKEYPALIVGAPYGGVKEQGPGIYANEMAQHGYVVLTFDPAYNGYSEGEPRHLSSPDLFVEDFMAGVDFLGTRVFVDRDRIGAIGICGSGGFALSAAQVDPRIQAVATVSMYDIARMHKMGMNDSMSDEDRAGFLKMVADQRYADFEAVDPALTDRGALLGWDEDSHPVGIEFGEFYSRPRGYHPNSITQFTVTSAASWMNFGLLDNLSWLNGRPILLVMGEKAHSAYFSEDVYEAAAEPKELYTVPGANHVDLYDKTNLIPFEKLKGFFDDAL
ncbi:alpha/beta hydrolase [Pseudooceanicola marinus]|uniref:alpha/beta hydrolase n=1 Tax=Pseudooceanicola marinus TaxID=396013 RepID=UPI001CD71D3B|nr:alpha/beta hydrolase [Pseudooceanicola marinus]MCA1335440.1 alpha/beta hydrolase [Pseudooceanicola marinus]